MPRTDRSLYWCITSYEDEPFTFDEASHAYMCYQQETCPKTHRLHWQGYVIFLVPTSLSQCKRSCGGSRIHAESSKPENMDEAIAYCSKDDTAVPHTYDEWGVRPDQPPAGSDMSSCTEFARFAASITAETKLSDVARLQPSQFIRYARGISSLISALRPIEHRSGPTYVTLLFGNTGTGKTSYVRKKYPGTVEDPFRDLHVQDPYEPMFNNYRGQHVMLIDDVDFTSQRELPISHWLRLLDRYPLMLRCLYGTVACEASKFYITSNIEPSEWYPFAAQAHRDALLRRITTRINFPLNPVWVAPTNWVLLD